MSSIDLNSIVICNSQFDEFELSKYFSLCVDYRIKKVFFTYSVDFDLHTVTEICDRMKRAQEKCDRLKPYGVTVKVVPDAVFTTSFAYDPYIERFANRYKYLFMHLPLFSNIDEADYNYYLHKRKLKAIFTAFERNLITNSNDYLLRIARSRDSILLVDINYIYNDSLKPYLLYLYQNNVRIYPCFSSGNPADYKGLAAKLNRFKNKQPTSNYTKLYELFLNTRKFVFNIKIE